MNLYQPAMHWQKLPRIIPAAYFRRLAKHLTLLFVLGALPTCTVYAQQPPYMDAALPIDNCGDETKTPCIKSYGDDSGIPESYRNRDVLEVWYTPRKRNRDNGMGAYLRHRHKIEIRSACVVRDSAGDSGSTQGTGYFHVKFPIWKKSDGDVPRDPNDNAKPLYSGCDGEGVWDRETAEGEMLYPGQTYRFHGYAHDTYSWSQPSTVYQETTIPGSLPSPASLPETLTLSSEAEYTGSDPEKAVFSVETTGGSGFAVSLQIGRGGSTWATSATTLLLCDSGEFCLRYGQTYTITAVATAGTETTEVSMMFTVKEKPQPQQARKLSFNDNMGNLIAALAGQAATIAALREEAPGKWRRKLEIAARRHCYTLKVLQRPYDGTNRSCP